MIQHSLVVWCVALMLTLGLGHRVAAQPKGDIVFALHVTVAPAWFDPAEMPAQITPFIIGYTLHDALVRALPWRTHGGGAGRELE
jgi:peptide/nickel transport system substrate-binding protein